MFKKIFVSLIITSYAFLTLAATPAHALLGTGPWYDQSPTQFYSQVYGDNDTEIFGERYTAAQVQWVMYSVPSVILNMIVHLVGFSPKNIADIFGHNAAGFSPISTSLTQPEPIAESPSPSLLSKIFTDRPLSGITYTKQKLGNFKFVPEARAQETGFGYQGLGPIQELWKATRNMSYTVFVLITLVLAFMIMFRVKLNPQTVISIQSTLPKVFIALILVTFSYAIAGFLVDLMYVTIGLISLLLSASDPSKVATTFDFLTKGIDPLGAINLPVTQNLIVEGSLPVGGIFGTIIYLLWIYVVVFLAFLYGSSGSIVMGFVGLILLVVFVLLSIFIFFKLTLLLIRTFAEILLMTIFAPLQITLGILFPDIGFGSWLKSYAAKLAVFPVVGLMIMLSYTFALSTLSSVEAMVGDDSPIGIEIPTQIPALATSLSLTSQNQFGDSGWPPFLNIGGNFLAIIFIIMSFEILHKTPEVANMIQGILSGKGPGSYGSALTTGAGLAVGAYAGRTAMQTAEAERVARLTASGAPETETAARARRWQQRVENFQRGFGRR